MLFPSRVNSSFWAWDTEQATPDLIRTVRMYFSPKKFLISIRQPFSWITTSIAHRPRLVTEAQSDTLGPVLCWPQIVWSASSSFLSPLSHICQPRAASFLSKDTEFCVDVTEVPLQGASGVLHNNCAPSEWRGHFLGHQQSDRWERSSSWEWKWQRLGWCLALHGPSVLACMRKWQYWWVRWKKRNT